MKLTINQDLAVSETEIIINCAHVDGRLRHLIELIRQHGFSLTGYQEGKEYRIPLEQIYFMDSADGKTFLYLEKEVYFCRDTLACATYCAGRKTAPYFFCKDQQKLHHQHRLFEKRAHAL